MNFTITEIKPVETSFDILTKLGIELDLNEVLTEEFEAGLASDITNAY